MRLKKIISASLAAVTIFSAGDALLQASQNSANIVEAAKKKSKKLTHNAAIYNSKGKRVGKSTLKKGKKVKILGTKKIKGKKYYRINKNKYVKVANFKKVKQSKKTDSTQEDFINPTLPAGTVATAKKDTYSYIKDYDNNTGEYKYTRSEPIKAGTSIIIPDEQYGGHKFIDILSLTKSNESAAVYRKDFDIKKLNKDEKKYTKLLDDISLTSAGITGSALDDLVTTTNTKTYSLNKGNLVETNKTIAKGKAISFLDSDDYSFMPSIYKIDGIWVISTPNDGYIKVSDVKLIPHVATNDDEDEETQTSDYLDYDFFNIKD